MKKHLLIISLLLIIGCGKTDIELAMERGIQYYEWNQVDDAIKEFNYIVHRYKAEDKKLKLYEIDLLARAHYNLAVSYAKKGWYDVAVSEAKKAFKLKPSDENRKILKAIQGKLIEPENKQPTKETTIEKSAKK